MNKIDDLFKCLYNDVSYIFPGIDKNDDYVRTHLLRYKLSLEYIQPYLELNPVILELGNKGYFCKIINYLYPHIQIECIVSDLRYDFNTNVSDKYDMILCMEVLEHIKDQEHSDDILNMSNLHLETFMGDGVISLLSNCNRLMKSTGKLFLTTPNINGYMNIKRIINYDYPFGYEPHPREFTYKNVIYFLEKAGFKVDKLDFFNCWHILTQEEKQKIDELSSYFTKETHREDDMFFIASRKI